LPDLATNRTIEWSLDQPAESFVVVEDGISYLLAFTHQGKVVTFNLTDWEEIEVSQLRDTTVIEIKLGNFDNDIEMEVIQLTQTELVLYNLHSLSISDNAKNLLLPFFTLSSFPNPFNSTVTISFSVPAGQVSESVRLAIYDLSGRLVADLTPAATRGVVAAERHLIWNASGQPAGIYFVSLNSDVTSTIKKITLVN